MVVKYLLHFKVKQNLLIQLAKQDINVFLPQVREQILLFALAI
jgi:hypothetical protein